MQHIQMTIQQHDTSIVPASSTFDSMEDVPGECEGVTPSTNDVLMGRGNSHKNHPGNIIFQGLIKKYRKQYFQVDTLVNKRNTIVEIISQCHQNGSRFLEQKQSASKSSSSESKDMVWTVLTKERTFRKVSLAIQYRQRCNASSSSKSAADADAAGTVSPTNPTTTVTSLSPAKVSPTSAMDKSSCSDIGSSPNIVQSYMDHHSNHNDNHQSLPYGYLHTSMKLSSTMPPIRVQSTTANPGYGYSLSASYAAQPPPTSTTAPSDFEKKSHTQHQPTFTMSNGIVVSTSRTMDKMQASPDEFTDQYEDAMHWMNRSNGNRNGMTTSAPWSLPFLSNAMSTLPPFQSSIFLRQRDDNLNLSHHNQHLQYNGTTNPPQRSGNAKMMMMPQQGRHNMDAMLYAPTIRSHMEGFTNGDHRNKGNDDDDSDPIPISEIFGVPTSNYNGSSWGAQNLSHYNNNTQVIRSSSIVSPRPSYSNCILSPLREQQQRSCIRRVSNFNENDHGPQHHNHNHYSTDRHNKSSGNDEIESTTDSITTIETCARNEFNQIALDTSDTLTIVATDSTASLSSGDESGHRSAIVTTLIAKNENCNDKGHDEDFHKNTISDSAISNGVSISDSSTCSHSDETTTSILYNDLCLSPLSFSTMTSPQPYQDHFISDDDIFNHCHSSNADVPILQLPCL